MKRNIKLLKHNMLHYVIAFNALILVVIAVMGIYLFQYYYSTVQEDFYENNELYLTNAAKTHENELQIMKDIAMQLELSQDSKFILEKQPTKSAGLKKMLHQFRAVNQFFDVAYFYYQKDNYVFNHMTSMKLDFFCEKAYSLELYSSEELMARLAEKRTRPYVFPEEELSGEMVYAYDERDRSAIYLIPVVPSYDSILIFLIGDDHLDSLLMDDAENQRNTYLLFDGEIIAERSFCEIDGEELKMKLTGLDGQSDIKLGNISYVLTEKTGSDGFSYACLQPMNVFSGNLRSHSWGLVILMVLCCLPAVLMIFLLSRRLLVGVRTISSKLQDEGDPYSLERIGSGIQDLMDQSRGMKQDQLSLRKNRFIRSFIQSRYTAMEVLRRDAIAAEIDVSLGCHMVGMIGSRTEEHVERVLDQIHAYIQASEGLSGHGMYLMNANQRVLVLFGKNEEALYRAYTDILEIGKKLCEEFVVAVSWPHKSMLNGSLSYLEANSAYDSRFLMDNSQIIRFTEIGQNSSITSYSELRSRYMIQLENTIRVGNEEEVEKAIRDLCEKLKEEHATLLTFRLLYDEILRFLMTQWKGEEKDWNQIYNVFTLSRCLTFDDFTSLLTEACHMLLDTQTDAKNQQSELVTQAIMKMRTEYGNADLNMTALADSLGISPVTLAVEFKNETGINPSDYLAVVRLDRAKELLKNTDMLIKDISSAVGYEDDHVFIRRFKKYTGKTPGQYRKEEGTI